MVSNDLVRHPFQSCAQNAEAVRRGVVVVVFGPRISLRARPPRARSLLRRAGAGHRAIGSDQAAGCALDFRELDGAGISHWLASLAAHAGGIILSGADP